MSLNPTTPEGLVPKVQDDVDVALEAAKLQAKEERRIAIGTLLDRATEVLGDVLDTTDAAHEGARMRAAEVAVNLYLQSENSERQDKLLDMQDRRLRIEEAKLRLPGGALYQQNNVQNNTVYVNMTPEQRQVEADMLLQRKQAQSAILSEYLPPAPQVSDGEEEDEEELVEETPADTTTDTE